MTILPWSAERDLINIYGEAVVENRRAYAKHGDQSGVPNGTALGRDAFDALYARRACDKAFAQGRGTWRLILAEEVAEAFAEWKPELLRAELVQVAAVAAAWIAAIDKGEQGVVSR